MKVQRLVIEQHFAKIEVDSTRAGLSIETHRRSMSVQHQRAQMVIQRKSPEVKLDMDSFYESLGLQTIRSFTKSNVSKAYELARQGVERIVREGNYIGTLPNSGKQIAEVAYNRMKQSTAPAMNSGVVPLGAIKMFGNPGDINIDWQKYDMKISWEPFELPSITVEPKPSVEIRLAREPRVEINVIEEYIPPETGYAIDVEA